MKFQILFSRKSETKMFQNMLSADFLPSILSVKNMLCPCFCNIDRLFITFVFGFIELIKYFFVSLLGAHAILLEMLGPVSVFKDALMNGDVGTME